MSITQFTKQQLSDWKRYEHVRQGGRWNMFDPNARAATGLSRERYVFALEHYSELKTAVVFCSSTHYIPVLHSPLRLAAAESVLPR